MEIEVVKNLLDYGLSVGVLLVALVLIMRYLFPRVEKRFDSVEKSVSDNTAQLAALTLAITEQTRSLTAMMKTCEKAFDDNRRVIEILLNRQTGK